MSESHRQVGSESSGGVLRLGRCVSHRLSSFASIEHQNGLLSPLEAIFLSSGYPAGWMTLAGVFLEAENESGEVEF